MTDDSRLQSLIKLVERILPFGKWNFQQTYSYAAVESPTFVIYDSEWCRVRLSIGGGDRFGGPEMTISYGRSHAPNNEFIMIWNGEECHCWHPVSYALDYLDGSPPCEAIERLRLKDTWSQIQEEFRQSELGRSLKNNHPEFTTRMHASIWEHYGQRLFELFDLRRPELWDEYTRFVVEYRRLQGHKPLSGYPSFDKIC